MARCAVCGGDNKSDASVKAGSAATASFRRGGPTVGLVLAGLAVATAVGYFVGTRSASRLLVEQAKTMASAASATRLHAVEPATPVMAAAEPPAPDSAAPPRHKAVPTKAAGVKKAAPSATTPPPVAADPASGRWAKLRQELAACGKFNLVCHEKVRWRYCKGMWGKVADCPQSSANAPEN